MRGKGAAFLRDETGDDVGLALDEQLHRLISGISFLRISLAMRVPFFVWPAPCRTKISAVGFIDLGQCTVFQGRFASN